MSKAMAMGTGQKWAGMILMLSVLLLAGVRPGHTWGGPRVGIGIGIGPFWGPYWGPYAYPYGYPPVVAVPSTQVYVQPSAPAATQPPPPAYWYYCDDARGYYPYVEKCPGGWRPVAPTPP